MNILEGGFDKAQRFGLKETSKALYQNICDENGLNPKTGEQSKSGSHEEWRVNFYTALGIAEESLKGSVPVTNIVAPYRSVLDIMSR